MFRKSTLALAALATLGASTLAITSDANAMRVIGGHGGGLHRPGISHIPRGPHWVRPWRPGRIWVGGRYIVRPAVAVGVIGATTAIARSNGPCTCLTKEYTPDNLVVFKDVCTKEVASAPAGNTQALLPMPQQDAPATTQQ